MQSNISRTYKEELFSNLKNKEYREAFVASHINNGIPFQIRTLREHAPLTQAELGKLAGMKQTQICRLENPNYGSFTLKTLKEIAAAFDVALMVRFVPFSDLVKWDLDLSAETLRVENFDKDPYFQEKTEEDLNIYVGADHLKPHSLAYGEVIKIDNIKEEIKTEILEAYRSKQKTVTDRGMVENPALMLSMGG